MLAIIAGESVMHDSQPAVATVHLYPEASHAVNGEHPDEIAEEVAGFLEDNP